MLKHAEVRVTLRLNVAKYDATRSVRDMVYGHVEVGMDSDTAQINDVHIESVDVLCEDRKVTCSNASCHRRHQYENDLAELLPNVKELEEKAPKGTVFPVGHCICGHLAYMEKELMGKEDQHDQ